MLSLALLPGFAQWGTHLDELIARPEALWIYGPAGAGASTLAETLAQRRNVPWLEADGTEARWLALQPRGVVAARTEPPNHLACLILRLPGLDACPEAIPGLLAAYAEAEGIAGPLPTVLGLLPCPGNLRELRNRLLRWKLLGQLPVPEAVGGQRLETEDLATNLHELERFLLHQALRRAYGNRVEAARRLGVSRRQLYLLIRRHGDPVRGEAGAGDLPHRVKKRLPAQNSSPDGDTR